MHTYTRAYLQPPVEWSDEKVVNHFVTKFAEALKVLAGRACVRVCVCVCVLRVYVCVRVCMCVLSYLRVRSTAA